MRSIKDSNFAFVENQDFVGMSKNQLFGLSEQLQVKISLDP